MNKYYRQPEAILDLHQMTRDEAGREVRDFLEEARSAGYNKVRIITGKGLHSENGIGVLSAYVKETLDRGGYEHFKAKYDEGGEGAIDILIH
jgi:DNA-nicking Smr family endonuclease